MQKPLPKLNLKIQKKEDLLAGTTASAGVGCYLYYSANQHYNKNKTTTTDADHLHNKIVIQDKFWPATFVVNGLCGVMTILNASKQSKARKKMEFSALPVEGWGMVMMKWKLY